MYEEGDIADGPNGPLIFQGGQWVPMQANPNVIPPNPLRVAQEQAQVARQAASDQREQVRFEERNRPNLPAGYQLGPDGVAQRIPGLPDSATEAGNPEMTATTRANAINAFTATRQLDTLIADIERKFRAGPGSTKGIYGAQDYLPTPTNRRFDEAGNAVRGAAITALGFTSGQTNTAREVEMNIGPYIPAAGDYDDVILDKIQRLKELRDRARVQATTILGGVPNASGRITPVDQLSREDRERLFPAGTLQPGIGGGPDLPSGGGASGQSGPVNPTNPGGMPRLGAGEQVVFGGDQAPIIGDRLSSPQEQDIAQAIRQGDRGQALALLQRYSGAAPTQDTIRSVEQAIDYARKNPNESVSFGYGQGDQRAQQQADFERYGNYLAPEIAERQQGGVTGQIGSGARGVANSLTLGAAPYIAAGAQSLFGDETFSDRLQRARATMEADWRVNPLSTLAGEVGGGVASAGGLELGLARLGGRLGGVAGSVVGSPRTADALYGLTSAGLNSGGDTGATAVGGAVGVGGGMFGRGLARGVGRLATGVQNASAQALRGAGVPLTGGQAAGGILKGIEDRLSGAPIIGDVIRNRRTEGLEAFNRAAFDEGLTPINSTTGGAIREQGVEAARAARSQAYDRALNGVQVQADGPFVADMQAAINAGRALPDPMASNLEYTLPTRVGNSFDEGGGLSGRDFQQSLRGLRRDAKAVENLPYGWDFGNVTRQAEEALEGLLNRQAPGTVPAYRAANAANRNVEILKDATNRARNGSRSGEVGVFTPSQLSDAAAQNARRFGGTEGTTQQPFFNLTRAGQEILPSQVPDSGTAGRLATLALPGILGGVGAGAGYAGGDTQTGLGGGLALGALLTAGGSRAAQQALVKALLDRPAPIRAFGRQVNDRAYLGGMFGAPLAALAAQ